MIEDPIEICGVHHWSSVIRSNIGTELFYISGPEPKGLSLISIIGNASLPSEYRVISKFSIFMKERPEYKYSVNNKFLSKERFISVLSDKYPNYLEWFIFNPEWLC